MSAQQRLTTLSMAPYMSEPSGRHDTQTATTDVKPSGIRIIIVGAGFAGMMLSVRLLMAGFTPDDLLIVDPAGGFGGTWYWNRE